MTERPFWSDGFDMDLPKVFPRARALLGEVADVELWTEGGLDSRTGGLGHPAVWNGDHHMLAFFGLRNMQPCRPAVYVTGGAAMIRCTAWEMFRDAWAHHYLIHVEGRPVWDARRLWRPFEQIIWDLRNWGPMPHHDVPAARRAVLRSYVKAVRVFHDIVDSHELRWGRVRRVT